MDRLVRTDEDGVGVDKILTDLRFQLSEKIQEFVPVFAELGLLLNTETDASSRLILSNLRDGLGSAIDDFESNII